MNIPTAHDIAEQKMNEEAAKLRRQWERAHAARMMDASRTKLDIPADDNWHAESDKFAFWLIMSIPIGFLFATLFVLGIYVAADILR